MTTIKKQATREQIIDDAKSKNVCGCCVYCEKQYMSFWTLDDDKEYAPTNRGYCRRYKGMFELSQTCDHFHSWAIIQAQLKKGGTNNDLCE